MKNDTQMTGNDENSADESQLLKVLLVDDQEIVAVAIRKMLEGQGMELRYCNDPSKAVQEANAFQPTVILQDLIMPDVDGYTLLRFYRKNPATSAIPVIVLSSKEDPKDKSQAFTNGANDYLVKLPDKIELIARVRAHSKSYLAQKERDEAYRELTKLKQKLEESNAVLQRLSVLDGLTGLANRRHFDEILQQEWKRAMRDETNISVILLDIDFFKRYNDNYGHQGGDDCLRAVSSALSKAIHRPGDFIARYGGEEFVAILPETDINGAVKIAEIMRANVEEANIPHAFSDATDHVTISLGVASVTPGSEQLPQELIEQADQALYRAKEKGRNQYQTAP